MVKISTLLKKLWFDRKEFITASELRRYCKVLDLEYEDGLHYLLKTKHVLRIFRGIFYVKSVEEYKLGTTKYNHLELVAKGLQLKGIDRWYFGLHTALKINNMTHEYFTVDYVLNDTISRSKPINIVGYRLSFSKIKQSLFKFGITYESHSGIRYSDPEKTILDFIYLSRFKDFSPEKIISEVSEWTSTISSKRLKEYSLNYPKTVVHIVERLIDEI